MIVREEWTISAYEKKINENDRNRWKNGPLEEFRRNAMIEMCRLLQVGQVRNLYKNFF